MLPPLRPEGRKEENADKVMEGMGSLEVVSLEASPRLLLRSPGLL